MSLIAELQRQRGLFVRCPSCDEEFGLREAVVFDATKKRLPFIAREWLQSHKQRIAAKRAELEAQKAAAKQRPAVVAESVNIGLVVENIAPSLPGFPVVSSDCRSLFEPIDFIVFDGLTAHGEVSRVLFVDVKTGNARLNGHQPQIKRLVECGEVRFTVEERPTRQ